LLLALPVVILVGWALNFTIPVYSVSPGDALDVSKLIQVNGSSFETGSGSILMTDVSLQQVTPFLWLIDHLNSSITLEPASSILGTSSEKSFNADQLSQMANAKVAAAVAALGYLHRPVATKYGAEILAVLSGTPAAGKLKVGDLVYAVDGEETPSDTSFQATIQGYSPGSTVQLSVLRQTMFKGGIKTDTISVPITLGKDPKNPAKAFLGVEFSLGTYFVLPIAVKISTGSIGGPSAGLAFALGIVEDLSRTSVTHGLKVAATGTMNALGDVGDVGGVKQKTITVRNAGANVFLVPPQEYKIAKSVAGPKMKVFAVKTLSGAIAILNKLT
jgi:PDZ domain-containing protein